MKTTKYILIFSILLITNTFSQTNKIRIGVSVGIGKGNLIPHYAIAKDLNYKTSYTSDIGISYFFNNGFGFNAKILYSQLPINNTFYFLEYFGQDAIIIENTGYFNLIGMGFNLAFTTNKRNFNFYSELGINIYYPTKYKIYCDKEIDYQRSILPVALNNEIGFIIKFTNIISIKLGGEINYPFSNSRKSQVNRYASYYGKLGLVINVNK